MINPADLSDEELEAIAADDLKGFIGAAAKRVGVRPDLAVAVGHQESRFNPGAVSPKGARGAMQLMPDTAKELGVDIDDPWDNALGGVTYLKRQLDEFGDERLALAAYNAGPGAVKKHGGVPPFAETQDYVEKILGGGAAPAADEPTDLASMSDEELEAIASGEPPDVSTEEAQDVPDLPTVETPKTALTAKERRSTIVDAEEGRAATPAQEAWYVGEIQSGRLDPEKVRAGGYRPGSEEFPLLQRDPDDVPKPGDWYVTPDGEKRQVAEVPMQDTAGNIARMIADPNFRLMAQAQPELLDDRSAAMLRALESGVMLGGRNELRAGIESIPALFEGGVPLLKERFGDVREREDRESAQARRDFPIAYDASAVAGGLMSGVALPAGGASAASRAAVGAATGGAGGFLATDGDLGERGVGAALGAAAGGVAPLVLPRLLGPALDLTGVPRRVDEKSWAAVEETLQRMGTRLDDLRPEARAFLTEQMSRGVEPADAAVMALNRGLPAEIPLTRGDITGLPEDQFAFNAALRGARGERAAAQAQDITARRQDAIRQVSDRIAADMAGTDIPMRNAGGARAAQALADERIAQKAGVDYAYEVARRSDGGATVPSHDAQILSARLLDAVKDFDAERVPFVAKELQKLDGRAADDVSIRDLFDMRARLSNLRSGEGVEATAAGNAVKAFDTFIQDAIEADVFKGDMKAVAAWRNAIKANRDFAEVFKQGDLVDRLTRQTGNGSARQLAVDPGDAANYIFGRSALGGAGRQNLYRDLVKVRDLLGADSEAWNGLRAEAFLRIAQAGEGAVEGGAQQFSGANFLKAWNKAKGQDERLINLLFKPEEKSTIDQFAALSARVTNPVKGGDNPSNTAAALSLLRKIGSFSLSVGKMTPFISQAFEELEKVAGARAARQAMKPVPRKLPVPMRGVPGTTGGYPAAELATPER